MQCLANLNALNLLLMESAWRIRYLSEICFFLSYFTYQTRRSMCKSVQKTVICILSYPALGYEEQPSKPRFARMVSETFLRHSRTLSQKSLLHRWQLAPRMIFVILLNIWILIWTFLATMSWKPRVLSMSFPLSALSLLSKEWYLEKLFFTQKVSLPDSSNTYEVLHAAAPDEGPHNRSLQTYWIPYERASVFF